MPQKYSAMLREVARFSGGKKALRKYRQFWGIPYPTSLEFIESPGKKKVLVGAGTTTGVYLCECPKKRPGCKEWSIKSKRRIAFDPNGRRVVLLANGSQKNFGKGLKFIGYARESHYIPTRAMENAGSFKKGRYWVHRHSDEGGSFPKVFKDAAGNYHYAPGTLRIGKWMRR